MGKLLAFPTFVTEYLYPSDPNVTHYGWMRNAVSSASGDRLYSGGGIHFGSRNMGRLDPPGEMGKISMSRCGSYLTYLRYQNNDMLFKVISSDGGRTLLTLPGLDIFKVGDGFAPSTDYQQSFPMGDKNLLLILSAGGKMLDVVDFDLASICARLSPDTAYVTSHPFPVVAQGRTFDYQIALNNPAALKSCKLRDNIPGSYLTPEGHFTYRALANPTGEPKQVNISVIIELKNGSIILHEFCIFTVAVD